MSMNSVYRAVINMFKPVRIIVRLHQEKVERIMYSSPIRLIVGGRARLVRLDSNHQIIINGRTVWSPRARIMVRL